MSLAFNGYRVPIFIVSYNRLSYLKQLVAWLEAANYKNIHIVDNNSDYVPLLRYLDNSPHQVHRMTKNYGHLVVWQCGMFDAVINHDYYVVSDCDVLPVEQCPSDAVEYFYRVLLRHKKSKVGFSLQIDDLPDTYAFKDKVISWEQQFWGPEIAPGLIDAPIDTTFALYRPGVQPSEGHFFTSSIRTNFPYTTRHLPWYQDSSRLSDEEIHYQKTLDGMATHWSLSDVSLLKEQNIQLQSAVRSLTREVRYLRSLYSSPGKLLRAALRRVRRNFRRNN